MSERTWFLTCPQGAVIDLASGAVTRGGCGWRSDSSAEPWPTPDEAAGGVGFGTCPECDVALHVEPVMPDGTPKAPPRDALKEIEELRSRLTDLERALRAKEPTNGPDAPTG